MTNADHNKVKEIDSALWKLLMSRGITLIIAGLVLLLFPQATLTVLIIILGIFWLVDGILTTVKSIRGRKIIEAWGWGIFTGVLGIIAGLVVLSHPLTSTILTTSFLIWFLGISAVIYGISGLVTGIRLRKESKGEWSMILGGIISVIFGIILMVSPFVSALVIIKTMGLVALIGGISVCIVAFRIKKKTVDK